MLQVKNLQKNYNGFTAVKQINFNIPAGQIFGFLGPNGAGKTTTISMLAGLLPPTSGQIIINGLNIQTHLKQIKSKIGLVPQELALYPSLSAYDNLAFFGRIYGLRGKELSKQIENVLEMVTLLDRAKDPIKTFSGGMKRRINLAVALLHQPDLIFLDEPTVGVDPQSRNAIFEGIETLNQAGMTILYTTHYMEEAERLCHAVAIMDKGQIIACDTPKALIKSVGEGIIQIGMFSAHARSVSACIQRSPNIKNITYTDELLNIETYQIQDALKEILEVSAQVSAKIRTLQILEPNLETVFLKLTGKSLRD